MDTLLRGVAIGFAVAAPVGPIGLLCIHRTLRYGFSAGFASGAGAALADAMYALLAGLALSSVTAIFAMLGRPLHLAGGAAIAVLGLRAMFTRRAAVEHSETARTTLASTFLSTFALTIANPLTILSFIGFVTASASIFNRSSALPFAAGTFIGSLLWWGVLGSCAAFARRRLNERLRRCIDVCSGAALMIFGLVALVR